MYDTSAKGGIDMNGLDQIVVALWFLPVVLFIIMPLCIGIVWLPISLFIKLFQRDTVTMSQMQTATS